MKKILVLINILLVLLTSCQQVSKSKFDNIPSSDTLCLKELSQAKTHVAKSKLVYCDFAFFPPLRDEVEMTETLKKFNIEYKKEVAGDVIINGITNNCYCGYMQEQINLKFGEKFIDSLLYVSDSIYISKNLDKTFDYSGWDVPPIFSGDDAPDPTNHSGLQKAFDKQFVYPKNYRYKSDSLSHAMATVFVDVDANGKALVDSCWFNFWNSRTKEADFNKPVWPDLEKTFKAIVEQTPWTPVKVKSFDVTSKSEIFIYLK